jgi:hypothetical protein
MAYKKHEQAIVPGSLNLLAPGDKSADGDCLQLTNWRVDQAGQLTQRWGFTILNPIQLSSYRLNRVSQVDSRIYFSGEGKVYLLGVNDPGGVDQEIDGGYTGGPVAIVSLQGLAWIMNNGKQRVDDGTYTRNWTPETPAAPTLAAGASGGSALLPGDWEYYVTFETVEGHEGNPSLVQVVTTVAGDRVSITRPSRVENMSKHDNTTSPAITGWNVYRTGNGLGAVYRVNTNVIPYATNPYYDNGAATGGTEDGQTNEDLQDRNITLETDHDAAPAAIGAIAGADGRIIAFRTIANPNRIFWTRANEPWYFPTANYADIGAVNDTIMAVSVKPNQTIIYKQKSIWRIVGELGVGRIEQVSTDAGCIGMNAIARSSSGDYIVGKEGVYRWNGESARKVSKKLDPLFADQDVAIANGITYERINNNLTNCALGIRNGRVYFSYPTGSATYPTDGGRTLVMDIDSGRWVDWETAWNDYYDQGQNGELIAAGDQIVGQLDTGYTDDTALGPVAVYDCVYHSRYEDQGQPDKEKTYADLVIEHNTRGQSMTVSVWANNGAAVSDEYILGSISSTARGKSIFRVIDGSGNPIRAYNLAIRIEGSTDSAQTAPIIIYAVFLHSYLEATQARTFDTDETTLGSPLMKEVREIAIDAQIDGTTTMNLWTDYPGNAMTKRTVFAGAEPKSLAATTGRTRIQIPLDEYTFGRLLRVTAQSAASKFQLYGMWLLVRAIGVFIEAYEATSGGFWDSSPQDFGVQGWKEAREIELDLDTGGAITYTLTADVNFVPATVATGTVNTNLTTSRRRIVRLPLADPQANLWSLRLSGTQEIILYSARIFIRPIGVRLSIDESTGGLYWDSDVLDFGIQDVKDFTELQLDVQTTNTAITVTVYTDLLGRAMAARLTTTINTNTARQFINLPLSNVQGHLMRVTVAGLVASSSFRIWGMRARVRPYFYYVEASTAAAGAIYDSTELTWGTPGPKEFDSLVVDYEGGPLTATFYTDLPGDAMASRVTYIVPASTGRRTATIPLNQVKGRLARFTLAGSAAYKLYGGTVRLRPVALYLNGANSESYRTRDLDFGTEAVKMFGEFEADVELNGTATLNVYADQPGGAPALVSSYVLTGAGTRKALKLRAAPTIKGRLVRLEVVAGSDPIIIHAMRVYLKAMGQRGGTEWQWAPVEMPSTPATYTEAPIPVKATPEQWEWVDVPVRKTPTDWQWADFPVRKTPDQFEWVEVPVEQ